MNLRMLAHHVAHAELGKLEIRSDSRRGHNHYADVTVWVNDRALREMGFRADNEQAGVLNPLPMNEQGKLDYTQTRDTHQGGDYSEQPQRDPLSGGLISTRYRGQTVHDWSQHKVSVPVDSLKATSFGLQATLDLMNGDGQYVRVRVSAKDGQSRVYPTW